MNIRISSADPALLAREGFFSSVFSIFAVSPSYRIFAVDGASLPYIAWNAPQFSNSTTPSGLEGITLRSFKGQIMQKFALMVGGFLFLAGCSRDAELRRELAELKASVNEQKQRVETVEQEAKVTEECVEQVSRRPTFTIEEPTLSFESAASPSPSGNAVDVILNSVSVLSTKGGGGVWDESGPPDLKVKFETYSASYTTPTQQDTHSASFGSRVIRVSEGDTLTVKVSDGDVFKDDTIGEYTKVITAETIRQGTVTWSFGRVNELVLRFEP
ncbi:MAG: hypothetical protein SH850_09330 [Planctomycetaceae bacterium]|nr:hypothetical protein [Planctomycetaceae bacterium]